MFNIKKRIIRKIFFIIIFIYNEKFILNAAEVRSMGRVDGIDYQMENTYRLMAERFHKQGKSYEAQTELLKAQNRHREAGEMNQRAQKAYRESAYCHKKNAELFLNQSKMEEAAEEYDAARFKFDDLVKYYTKQAELFNIQNRNGEAEEMLQEATMTEQEYKGACKKEAHCREKYAGLLFDLGKIHEASAELLLNEAERKKEYDAAEKAYKNAVAQYKKKLRLVNFLNIPGSEERLEANEDIAKAYHYAGLLYKKEAEWLKIKSGIEGAILKYEESTNLFNNAVTYYIEMVEEEKRRENHHPHEAFEKTAKEFYKAAASYTDWAESLEISGKKEEAATMFKKASEQLDNAVNWYTKNALAHKSQNEGSAANAYKKIVEVLNNALLLYEKQAKLLKCLGKEEEAQIMNKNALEVNEEIAYAYNNAGDSHQLQAFLLKNKEEAVKEYENSRKAYSDAIPFYEKKQNYEMIAEMHNNAAICYKKKFELIEKELKEAEYKKIAFYYNLAGVYYNRAAELTDDKISIEAVHKYEKSKEAFLNAEMYSIPLEKKFDEFIKKAIKSKRGLEIKKNYNEAYNLQPQETNNRIISLKRDPFKTTLPVSATISFFPVYYCFSNKSTIFEKLRIKCWQNEIIIGLATTAILLATGIHLCINNNQHKELFRLHEERLKNNAP